MKRFFKRSEGAARRGAWCALAWILASTLPPGLSSARAAERDGKALLFVSDASYPPYTYLSEGAAKGVAVDMVRALSERIGRPIEMRLMAWEEAQAMVARGEADGLFPMSITDARRQSFDFSDAVLDLDYAIFTLAGRAEIAGLADLRGQRVAVTGGGLPRQMLQSDARVRLAVVDDYPKGFQMLKAGAVDAMVADRWVGGFELARLKIDGVRASEEAITRLQAGAAVRKGDGELLAALNDGLRAMRADGTLERIVRTWRPKEVIYVTREQMGRWKLVGAFGGLALVSVVLGFWMLALRRQVRARSLAETQVAALNQRLSLATRSAGIGIWDLDVRKKVLVWDDEMCRIYRVPRETFSGAPAVWVNALHPDDRERAQAEVSTALEGQKAFDTVFRIVWPDGAVRTIHASAQIVRGGDGRPVRMVGVNFDVTERVRAEEEVRTSEARLRSLSDHLPDSLVYRVVRESAGAMRFLYISAGVERLFGLKPGEVLLDSSLIYARMVDEDRARFVAARDVSARAMSVINIEVRRRREDGEVRWLHISSTPHRLPDGRMAWDGIAQDITARKAAEEKLRENELRFSTVFANTFDAIGVSKQGRVIFVNPAFVTLFGYANADEFRGREIFDFIAAENHPQIAAGMARRASGDLRPAAYEFKGVRRDGTTFDMEVQAAPFSLAGEVHVVGIHRDITERKRAESEVRQLLADAERSSAALLNILEDQKLAEEALRASEEKFRSAMFNSAVGMAIVGPDGSWREANPTLCRIVGYAREELLAMDFQTITHPDDIERDLAALRGLLAGEAETYESEKRYLHKTGREVWVQLNVSRVLDAQGRLQNFVSQMQDITARKRAEESFAAAAERLALALRASKLGVWRHNLQTRVTEWDARMFSIFGLPPAEGAPGHEEILALIAEEDRAQVRRSWEAGPACERAYRMGFRIAHGDGRPRHIEVQGVVHDDAIGRPEWAIGVAGDITDIVRAAAESERLRTQLQQAQKMETLGTLAAGVAHDFNNLLTGINGFVDLAATTLPKNHEAVDLLKQARRGAMNARDLVRRILNFSRTKNEHTRMRVDIGEMVRETAPLISAGLRATISLSVEIAPDLPAVLADAGQLQQVLMNFCTNGAQAIGGRAGSVRIAVDVCELTAGTGSNPPQGCPAGRYVRLAVSDSGCGMDEATRKRIFEPFFTTKKAGEGTGLGLSIVHDIVSAHQGGIEVSSAVGKGTTFAVFLPVARQESAPAPVAAARAVGAGAGQRILVVDDEPAVAMVVRLSLQRGGYASEVYTSSLDGWKRFEAAPGDFDLVMLDQNMPDLSGMEFVHRARQKAPAVPIVMMSGRFEQGEVPEALKQVRVGTLKKPFEIAELFEAVKAGLKNGGSNGG